MRAVWIINASGKVCFSRKFPTVEKSWRRNLDEFFQTKEESRRFACVPFDSQLANALGQRLNPGTVNNDEGACEMPTDPICKRIISLPLETPEKATLSPLVVHSKDSFTIAVLPAVSPEQLMEFESVQSSNQCGYFGHGMALFLFESLEITRSFLLCHTIHQIILQDSMTAQPQPTIMTPVTGLLDNFLPTGKQKGSPSSPPSPSQPSASLAPNQKDSLRRYITAAMPHGTVLDLSPTWGQTLTLSPSPEALSPGTPDAPKAPSWKPVMLPAGRQQKCQFSVSEIVHASVYDRPDDISDDISVSGTLACHCDLEDVPEVSLSLSTGPPSPLNSFTLHPCCQAPEAAPSELSLLFSPPLGALPLLRYQRHLSPPHLPVTGFFQLRMEGTTEAHFYVKLQIQPVKSPLSLASLALTLPFPGRHVIDFSGAPSEGAVTTGDSWLEWRVFQRGVFGGAGKSQSPSFAGIVRFRAGEKKEAIAGCQLAQADWADPFCWEAYDHAKVSFRMTGGALSGLFLDPKKVAIHPARKAHTDVTYEVVSGNYILFNCLGLEYPRAQKPQWLEKSTTATL